MLASFPILASFKIKDLRTLLCFQCGNNDDALKYSIKMHTQVVIIFLLVFCEKEAPGHVCNICIS